MKLNIINTGFILCIFLIATGALADSHNAAIASACEYVYVDSLDRLLCLKNDQVRLEKGETLAIVVADTCDTLADIPESESLVSKCFENALPGSILPPGYPKPRQPICAQYAIERTQHKLNLKAIEIWQCSETLLSSLGKSRNDYCFLQLQDSLKNNALTLDTEAYYTLIFDHARPWTEFGTVIDFDLESKQSTLPYGGDPRVIWGKLTEDSKVSIDYTTYYRGTVWGPTIESHFELNKKSSMLSITTCKEGIFSCKTTHVSSASCLKIR